MTPVFVAIPLPLGVSQMLLGDRGALLGARWIDPGDCHLTLRFIGDVDCARLRDIVEVLDALTLAIGEIRLTHRGAFGGDRPRALIAHAENSANLAAARSSVDSQLRRLGLSADKRKFSPHVTLARLHEASAAQIAQWLEDRPFPPLAFTPTQMALYSSARSRGGGPYGVEAVFALRPKLYAYAHQ